jgi:hypothetical protein
LFHFLRYAEDFEYLVSCQVDKAVCDPEGTWDEEGQEFVRGDKAVWWIGTSLFDSAGKKGCQ